jgi:hypothetical protein
VLRLLICGAAVGAALDGGVSDAVGLDAGCSKLQCMGNGQGCLPQESRTSCHD